MQNYVQRLHSVVDQASVALLELPDTETALPLSPNKWSAREVLGHLIDSASSNHQRFVRAQFKDDLVFPGYDQDAWVAAQKYNETPWTNLVELWRALNFHVVRIMTATPEAVRLRPAVTHNLHDIAWQMLPASQPATLDFLMNDYVMHLEHHVRQILDREWSPDA